MWWCKDFGVFGSPHATILDLWFLLLLILDFGGGVLGSKGWWVRYWVMGLWVLHLLLDFGFLGLGVRVSLGMELGFGFCCEGGDGLRCGWRVRVSVEGGF